MSIPVPAPAGMTDLAREALHDVLTCGVEVDTLLDPNHYDADTSRDVAAELARLGYVTLDPDISMVRFTLELTPRPVSPHDQAQGLHDAITALTEALPAHDGPVVYQAEQMTALGLTPDMQGLRLLIAVRTVLQLAHHDANGRLSPGSVEAQFPHAAAALARALNQEGAPVDAP